MSKQEIHISKEYELGPKLYDPEYFAYPDKLDPRLKEFIISSRKEGIQFLKEFGNLDLTKDNYATSISEAYDRLVALGLDKKAERICTKCFKREVSTYGVSYPLFDICTGTCKFCAASEINRKRFKDSQKAALDTAESKRGESKDFQKVGLDTKDVVNEVLATMLQGHEEHCLLLGDMPEHICLQNLKKWIPEVIRVCGPLGIKIIVGNIQSLSEESYEELGRLVSQYNLEYGTDVKFNIRIFQETYGYSAYSEAIPMPTKDDRKNKSEKWNFAKRINTQARAAKAGLPVGMGLLLGICPKPLKDLVYLVAHQQRLLSSGAEVHRAAILSAHNVPDLATEVRFDLGYGEIYRKLMVICYVLFRIFADPSVSLVMSERDMLELLKELALFADHCTVGVHPSSGGTIYSMLEEQFAESEIEQVQEALNSSQSKHATRVLKEIIDRKKKPLPVITQALVYPNYPEDFMKEMKDLRYRVTLNKDPKHLEKIQKTLSDRIGFPITVNNFGGTRVQKKPVC
jgi:2-iminoacetate synthase ThiH